MNGLPYACSGKIFTQQQPNSLLHRVGLLQDSLPQLSNLSQSVRRHTMLKIINKIKLAENNQMHFSSIINWQTDQTKVL